MGMKPRPARIFARAGMDETTRGLIQAYLSNRPLPVAGTAIVGNVTGRKSSIVALLKQMVKGGELWDETFGAVTLYALRLPTEAAIQRALQAGGASALASYSKARGLCAAGWGQSAGANGCTKKAAEGRLCLGHADRRRKIGERAKSRKKVLL